MKHPFAAPALDAARLALAAQDFPTHTLYVVATPIGNLADLTLRALGVLQGVDVLACEDTRHTQGLLQAWGLDAKPLLAVHEHNEQEAAQALVARLAQGERIALVCDAGTPAVSDPGARVVATVRAAGFRVLPLPGASAVLTALSVSGDVGGQGFVFAGFLPPKATARKRALSDALAVRRGQPWSWVWYEAPHRILDTAQAFAELCAPQDQLTVCRELSKRFESVHTLPAQDGLAWLQADPQRQRGEFALVLHAPAQTGAPAQAVDPADDPAWDAVLRPLLDALPTGQACAVAARITGQARNRLYARAQALKGDAASPT